MTLKIMLIFFKSNASNNSFFVEIYTVILSLCRSEKNIIPSLIDSGGTVFPDDPIFQDFSYYFFTFVKIQLNLLLEEYFLLTFSLGMSRNMFLFYSNNLRYK